MSESAAKLKNTSDENKALVVKGDQSAHLFQIETQNTDLGRTNSFKFKILNWILDEKYDQAIEDLKNLLIKPSDYPTYHKRIERYVNHSVDLVYAIKAKRNFPGINSLTRAKQQELREKFKEHFKELQYILNRIEVIEKDLRINDAKSTIYVVRALWVAAIMFVIFSFLRELTSGLMGTTYVVADDIMGKAVDWLFDSLGL